MTRAGLTTERVVEEAGAVADEVGLAQLTLVAVADRLGVRVPSLYKHVDGLADLRLHLAVRAKREMTTVLTRATVGKARGDALRALATALWEWAYAHPGAYAAAQAAPGDDPDDQQASADAVQVVFDVLAGYDLADDALVDATRSLRAAVDGFIGLHQRDGFAMARPVEASFTWLLDTLDAAMTGDRLSPGPAASPGK